MGYVFLCLLQLLVSLIRAAITSLLWFLEAGLLPPNCRYRIGNALLSVPRSEALPFRKPVCFCLFFPPPQNMVLQNGTKVFDSWEKPPLPVYIQFYFFNVTNPEEILQGEIPLLEEVGPYTYR